MPDISKEEIVFTSLTTLLSLRFSLAVTAIYRNSGEYGKDSKNEHQTKDMLRAYDINIIPANTIQIKMFLNPSSSDV